MEADQHSKFHPFYSEFRLATMPRKLQSEVCRDLTNERAHKHVAHALVRDEALGLQ